MALGHELQILMGAQFAVFAIAWLLASRYLQEDRLAMVCWALYSASQATYHWGRVLEPRPAWTLLLLLLATLGSLLAVAGSDLFLHRKMRHGQAWLGLGVLGVGVVLISPVLGAPPHWRAVAYNLLVVASLWLPAVLMGRRVSAEFGRPGQSVLALVAFCGLAPLLRAGALVLDPSQVQSGLATHQPALASLLAALVLGDVFQLVFLALLVGRLVKGLRRLARHDGLTGLLNRSAFEEAVRRAWAMARRRPRPLSLAFLDIDHFKRINDLAGHTAGDRALSQVAALLSRQARETDTVARLGGEEFVLLMPETGPEGALEMAQRLQAELRVLGIPMPGGQGPLTVSIGLCSLTDFSGDAVALLALADQAMYQAKREGRDRIVVSGGGPVPRSSRFADLAEAA